MNALLFLLLYFVQIQSAYIYVNTSIDCTSSPCYVSNPELYIGGKVPETIDDVFFNFSGAILQVPQSYSFEIRSIFLGNVQFGVEDNASLLISGDMNIFNSFMLVEEMGSVIVNGNIFVQGSTIQSLGDFSLQGISIFNNTMLTFRQSPNLGNPEFYNISTFEPEVNGLIFPEGFSVNNSLKIISSTFSTRFSNNLENCKITFGGQSLIVLIASDFSLDTNNVEFIDDSQINFTFVGSWDLDGNLQIPGSIKIEENSRLSINGNLSVTGTVESIPSSNNYTYSGLQVLGTITAQQIILNSQIVLIPFGTIVIVGDLLVNENAAIYTSNVDNIIIQGNLYQDEGAIFYANDLENNATNPSNIYVEGFAILGGYLKLTTNESGIFYAMIISATEAINGIFFQSELLKDDESTNEFSVKYSPTEVIVQIGNEKSGVFSPYIWIAVCGAGLLLLLAIVGYVMLRTKRARYDPIGLNKYGN